MTGLLGKVWDNLLAIRGAITTNANDKAEILARSRELLQAIAIRNALKPTEIISIIFTATQDLNAAFPATAARELGWTDVALLDAVEIDVPGSLQKTIRVLMHVDRPHVPGVARHVYLGDAAQLRPDLK